MVHNGIEYGDIQLICEAYHLLKDAVGLTSQQMSEVFAQWNKEELDSFLIEITSHALAYKTQDGKHLVELIRDTAGQKGTGKWTGISALDLGVPVTLIGEAVFSRCLSAMKDERVKASTLIKGTPAIPIPNDKQAFINDIKLALYASKIVSYAQGFMLLREAAKAEGWHLNYGGIALMWRGGCIIRSQFLGKIKEAYDKDPELQNLLLDNFFKEAIEGAQQSWRRVVAHGVLSGIPTPAFSVALSFFDGYRSAKLPANLLQALRDYFGAHTYELADSPGVFHHTNWTGTGGNVSSSTYNA
jgi:6-phosphogluconate dehydrogenase